MADQSSHEPTMEEILASIRRIISEDDAPEGGASSAAAEEAPAEEAPVAHEEAPAEEAVEDDDVLELTETYDAAPAASVSIGDIEAYDPEPEPEPAPAPAPYVAPSSAEALVSAHTESYAASSFGSLSSALLVPHSDRTLEDVTRDLLRPLLQAWLDQHLPGIVETQVRQEVERIARQARR